MLRGFPKGRRKTEIVLEINELHFSGSKAHWGMLSLMHMDCNPVLNVFKYLIQAKSYLIIKVFQQQRHFGRDCRNPDGMDSSKLAILGTGCPHPCEHDEFFGLAEAAC